MNKEDKRKIVIPFTLEQFRDAIDRIKAEYHAGKLDLIGSFEIETLEYFYEKVKEKETPMKVNRETYYDENLMERITLYDLVSLIAMCDFELTLRVFGDYEQELINYKGCKYTDIVWDSIYRDNSVDMFKILDTDEIWIWISEPIR